MKMVVEILREDGGTWQWERYEIFRRKFDLDNMGGLEGKNKTKARNAKNGEEVYTKR